MAVSEDNHSKLEIVEEMCHQLGNSIDEIVTLLDADILYEKLCDYSTAIFGANKVAVLYYESKKNYCWLPHAVGLSPHYFDALKKEIQDLPGIEILQNNEPVFIEDINKSPQFISKLSHLQNENVGAAAFLPLASSPETLALLIIYFEEPHRFTAIEKEIGIALAKVAGSSLQKIHLLEEASTALIREKKVNDINLMLNSAKNLPTILLGIVRRSAELVQADAGLIGVLIDPEMMTFYPHKIPPIIPLRPAARGRGVAWQIVESGESILTNDYLSLANAQNKWGKMGINSFVGVPLQAGDETLGALTLFNLEPSQPFSERDLAILEMIGRQAATAIENARMFSEANHRANALANALNRQEELDKMKNQFIYKVSHELRSPLGIIYGHAELLESNAFGELAESQMESVKIITRRVRMLNDLVNDLTALLAAETQEFRRELINTTLLVTAVAADHKYKANELGIELLVEMADGLPWLNGDQTHLQRVFDNLFSNAFKFTPKDGRITLRVFQAEDKVQFELSDTGEGIETEKLARIFERFYQVQTKGKPRRYGTGLGLALVKEIVEAHRGTVTVSSEMGKGSTFTLIMPGYPAPEL